MTLTECTQAFDAPDGPARGVSVVVPTYNEAPNLPELLDRLRAAFRGQLEHEIIIADDASPDGTAEIGTRIASRLSIPLRVVARSGRRSLSLSVIEGARAARFPVVVVLDADLSHDPEEAPALARSVLEDGFDVAIASRYAPGSGIGPWPRWRRALSAVGTWLVPGGSCA